MGFNSDTPADRGFGRGTAVRDYWLGRCHGFRVTRADGRSLGVVKAIGHQDGQAVLRVGRRLAIPVDMIETVWPSTSVAVVADRGESAGRLPYIEADHGHARWEDDTLPWWELVEQEDARVGRSRDAVVVRRLAGGVSLRARRTARVAADRVRELRRVGHRRASALTDVLSGAWSDSSVRVQRLVSRLRRASAHATVRLAVRIGGDAELMAIVARAQSGERFDHETGANSSDNTPDSR